MKIEEIFEYIDKIGCLTFSTIGDDGFVHSRIAHFYAFDDGGFYFRTMRVKPFYRELKATGRITVSGIFPGSKINGKNDSGVPDFSPGYTFRLMGEVRELTEDEVKDKGAEKPDFKIALHDMKKYPATRCFVLFKGKGEVYDYDYETVNREHKLLRKRFSFGGVHYNNAGLKIMSNCIECGRCYDICTFDAVKIGSPFSIISERCDECGSCHETCPANAIEFPEDM